MKVLCYVICFLTLSVLFGCSSADEKCINLNKIGDEELGKLVGKELDKIYFEEDHFHRRTGDPSDYEVIELD